MWLKDNSRNSLKLQWLALCPVTVWVQVQFLVGELRSWKASLHSAVKKEKKIILVSLEEGMKHVWSEVKVTQSCPTLGILQARILEWVAFPFSGETCISSVVQSCPTLCDLPWTVAHQASLSITNSGSLLRLMYTESVMPSNHLILCHPLLLLLSIFPSIRVFSNESLLHIRWPNYWSFSFSISPSSEYSGLISLKIDWLDLLLGLSRVFSNITVQKHQFFGAQLSL